jgi:hypothetical protein
MILALLFLVLVTLFGYCVMMVLQPQARFVERVSLGYLLGWGIFTFSWFLLNRVGVPYTLKSAFLLILLSIAVPLTYLTITKARFKIGVQENAQRLRLALVQLPGWQKILVGVVCLLLVAPIIPSLYWPVKDWDSVVLYDYRAKTFAATGFMTEGIAGGYFFGYPLMTSLAHTVFHVAKFPYPGIVHSLFFVALVTLAYTSLRKNVERGWALVWTVMIAMSPGLFGHAFMTYTNLAYTAYLVVGYLYLHRWFIDKNRSTLIISALLIGMSTWTRSAEPFWLLPILLVVGAAVVQRKWLELVLFPSLVSIFRNTWIRFEQSHLDSSGSLTSNAPGYIQLLLKPENYLNIFVVTQYFFQHVILPSLMIYLFLAIGIWLFVRSKAYLKPDLVVMGLLIIGNLGLTFAGIFLFSLYYEDWRSVGGSAQRMSIFFGPLIFYFVAILSQDKYHIHMKRFKKGLK